MKTKAITRIIAVVLFGLTALLVYAGGAARTALQSLLSGDRQALAEEAGTAKVVFKVKCYDEGKAALAGMKGVRKIETGFHYIHETDTVYFDPQAVTIEEMEAALKKAGTFVETIRQQ